ncbi:hypothetical protein AZF37_00125 [endosymbiont 'TC1' of Trimyema compressum]|uniref:hypothetical protein n=1 Tax=endosymbiont 'TC1' of Trimyema compressum TaxID=243899 RepID=UPI0007F0623F|nr:hypothetical protein [endosymbiont 'TC1' of Trimyema compressum]AMP19790.1 hypothetical protein AZF37_00125 [endosymbiont 'TC1' of Trimyema compressum]
MENIGLSSEDHRSQGLTLELIENTDKILTMTKGHEEAIKAYFSDVEKIEEKAETLNFLLQARKVM